MKPSFSYPDTTARHWQLSNGLEVILKEDHSAPVASIQAWCGVGSIHEDLWAGAGLSHILEHLLFKGTETRKGPEIATRVQDVGGYINAYTSFDRTVFWIDTPSAGTAVSLDVLMDVMTRATLPEDEYHKEQEVIRREFAMGFDDPDHMSFQLLFATAYQLHPYRHPVIGYLDVFNQLTRDDVLRYYKKHYVPNNMLFVIVGNVDPDAVASQLEEHFSGIPRQPYAPVLLPNEPKQLGRRDEHIEFETQLTKSHLAWPIPDITHLDMPVLDVLAAILGQGRSSRLFKVIREEKRLAHVIGAHAYTPAHGGIFTISATLDPDKRMPAEKAINEIVDDLKRHPVSTGELEKAKKSSLTDMLEDLTTMRGQANDLATNWMLARNLNFTQEYLQSVYAVTDEDIQRVVKSYLREDSLTAVSLNPKHSLSKGGAKARSHFKPETECRRLANGLTLLLHRDARVPLVSARATFLAGSLAETPVTSGLTNLYARCLLKGTKSRSAAEIADAIEGVGGSIATVAGNNSVALSVGFLREDLDLGMEIFGDVLRHADFPPEELERERQIHLARLKSEEDHPVTVAARHLRKHLFPGHPYAEMPSGTEASIGNLTRQDLTEYHHRYACLKNGVVAVYGDIEPNETEDRIGKLFSKFTSGDRAFADDTSPPPPFEPRELNVPIEKQQAVLLVGYRGASVTSDDRLVLELIDEACSDMSSRLFMRIREEMGLAYYVSASQMLGLAGGAFFFYLGTDREKLAEVQSALNEEIGKLGAHGLTEEELQRAKMTYLGKHIMENQDTSSRAAVESLDELYGFGYNYADRMETAVKAISVEETAAVCCKYFHETSSVTVKVLPRDERDS